MTKIKKDTKFKRKIVKNDVKSNSFQNRKKNSINDSMVHSGFQRSIQNNEFEGRKILDKKTIEKYSKGNGVKITQLRKDSFAKKHHIKRKEKKFQEAVESTARAEILLTETPGLLEVKEETYTSHITQKEIRAAVDITAATKSFDLHLDHFGPYKFRYTQNGRHMVLGGRKGHLASFDWLTKKLSCEINVMESIHDVCYLHNEKMIAAAQKEWTYIYDHRGTELHCLKRMNRVLKLEFLPYHFLLCGGNENGFLSWLDVTLGQEILQTRTGLGRLDLMCQNPSNAVLCCGHPNGTISMWTPNSKKPVLSMLCHTRALRSIAIDPTGKYLATADVNRCVKIWDTRNLGNTLSTYGVSRGADNMTFSQTNLLAVSYRNVVEVFKNVTQRDNCEVYMRHDSKGIVTGLNFCPYEDVLGCSLYNGFSSLIIPGSGEPNFDALEVNPFKSFSAHKEAEVKSLLEKVPHELITLDPQSISQVDVPTLEEKLEARKQLHWVKVPKVDVQPKYRMKGKSGSAQKYKRKMKVKEDEKRKYLQFIKEQKRTAEKQKKAEETPYKPQILDRFKPKRKP